MTDEAHAVSETLWTEIHDLVDRRLEPLAEEDQEDIRNKLTDEFRFWKRATT